MAKKPIYAQEAKSLAPSWQQSEPTYTVGRSHIDGLDHVAHTLEKKWGVGRLRLLVPADLRARFDAQQQKVNHAIWHGELADVERETQRMVNAWKRLDHVAEVEVGAEKLSPVVWEAKMEDGRVLAFVRDSTEAWHVHQSGRRVTTYSMDQVVAILVENERRVKSEASPLIASREEGERLALHDKPNGHVEPVRDRGSVGGWGDQVPFSPEVR